MYKLPKYRDFNLATFHILSCQPDVNHYYYDYYYSKFNSFTLYQFPGYTREFCGELALRQHIKAVRRPEVTKVTRSDATIAVGPNIQSKVEQQSQEKH